MKNETRNELLQLLESINNDLCVNTKNELKLQGAYGGWQIQLTGKRDKRFNKSLKWLKNSLGSGCADITYGFKSGKEVLQELRDIYRTGVLKERIMRWEV